MKSKYQGHGVKVIHARWDVQKIRPFYSIHCHRACGFTRFKGRSRVQSVSPYALELLLRYSWPGNVRELVNAVEYAMVMSKGTQIMPTDLPENIQDRQVEQQQNHETVSLRDTEKDLIVKTLRDCRGNKHLAAKILRIPRSTLYSKLQKHGIYMDTRVETGVVPQDMHGDAERFAVQN